MTPNPKTWNGFYGFFKIFLINFFLTIFLNFLKTVAPKIFFFALPTKLSKFFTTSPVPIHISGQASMVTGPRIASNYGL